MNGGSSQSPSFSTGNSSGGSQSGGGWQQPFSSSNSQVSPFFNMAQPQLPQTQAQAQPSSSQGWASFSPTFNYFSQLAAQGQQTPLTAQQDNMTALAQQNALAAAQPTTPQINTPPVPQVIPGGAQFNPNIPKTTTLEQWLGQKMGTERDFNLWKNGGV